jgi:tetratricopeptide (TPR) repeat protein
VDARETWQALQARLTSARAAIDAGDRSRALDEINAALAIDPNFLAAHSLRDRITATPSGVASSGPSPASAPAVAVAPVAAPGASAPAIRFTGGYARFEQRAKRRRVDHRLDAARLAIETGRLKAAASALDEVIELDPNLPDLPELTAQFDELRRRAATTPRGPRVAFAAVFVLTVLGASWLHESTSVLSRPTIAAAPALATPMPFEAAIPAPAAVTTAGERDAVAVAESIDRRPKPAVATEPAEERIAVAPALARPPADLREVEPPMPTATPVAPPSVPRVIEAVQDSALSAPVDVVAAVSPPPAPPAPMPAAMPAAMSTPAVELSTDESLLVKQTLQLYRVAYEGLDARSAQAVWPAVNQAALARAFDGLASQSLTFDACDVRVRGELATATCQGSARYVPKIGSREPRTERRVWNFSLHKAGDDWKIESARAER